MGALISFAESGGPATWWCGSYYFDVLIKDAIAIAADGPQFASALESNMAIGFLAFDELDKDMAQHLFILVKKTALAVVNDETLPGMTWKERFANEPEPYRSLPGMNPEDYRRSIANLLELMTRYEPSIMCPGEVDRSLIPATISLAGFKQSTWWTWGHYYDALLMDMVAISSSDPQLVAHFQQWQGTDHRGFSYGDKDLARRVFATLRRTASAVVNDAMLPGMAWKENLARKFHAEYRQSLVALLTLLARYEPSIMALDDDQNRLLAPAVISMTNAEEFILWTRARFLDVILADVIATAGDDQDIDCLSISARNNCLDFSQLYIAFARQAFFSLKQVALMEAKDESMLGMTWKENLDSQLHEEYRQFVAILLNLLTQYEQSVLFPFATTRALPS